MGTGVATAVCNLCITLGYGAVAKKLTTEANFGERAADGKTLLNDRRGRSGSQSPHGVDPSCRLRAG
jgi:hypothetical protein